MLFKISALLAFFAAAQTQAQSQTPPQPTALQLNDVEGLEILPETCSFTTIYEKLGHFMPAGQIEGVSYISLKVDTLKARIAPYLKTPEQQAELDRWLGQTAVSNLRMRAKEVRFNQWGGQGADEWVMFCSKPDNVIYLLHRNLWSE